MMNKKTRVVLSSLALLTLSLSMGLVACKKQVTEQEALQANQQAAIRPIIDFDQDDDPYPDDYVLDNVPDETDQQAKKQKKDKRKSKALKKEQLKTQLEQAFPGIKVESIAAGPVPYLYEVKTQGDVLFATTDGELLFVGELLSLQNANKNYTEQARSGERLALLKMLSPKDTINFEAKNPKYTITVFTDTDCGYCRKFHEQIQAMNELGIAVRYAAFPRAGLQSKTFETMQTIWCAPDKNAAYTSAAQGQTLAKQSCATQSVQNQYQLGQKLGIRGTPALILEDGALIPGYMPAEGLKAMLDQHFQKNKSAV